MLVLAEEESDKEEGVAEEEDGVEGTGEIGSTKSMKRLAIVRKAG